MNVRLLAICEQCWHVGELGMSELVNQLGDDCTTADVKRRLFAGRKHGTGCYSPEASSFRIGSMPGQSPISTSMPSGPSNFIW